MDVRESKATDPGISPLLDVSPLDANCMRWERHSSDCRTIIRFIGSCIDTGFPHPDALADALLRTQIAAIKAGKIYEWLSRRYVIYRWFEQALLPAAVRGRGATPHAVPACRRTGSRSMTPPELFRGMMTRTACRVYRSDRAALATQPIRFSAESGNYIPFAPWAKTVRESLPSGAAAVLLNPVYKHAGFYGSMLPISAGPGQASGAGRRAGRVWGKSRRRRAATSSLCRSSSRNCGTTIRSCSTLRARRTGRQRPGGQ